MAARNAGATAVVLSSEDLDEILELSDRVAVMHEGLVVQAMLAEDAAPQEIGHHMLGHHRVSDRRAWRAAART